MIRRFAYALCLTGAGSAALALCAARPRVDDRRSSPTVASVVDAGVSDSGESDSGVPPDAGFEGLAFTQMPFDFCFFPDRPAQISDGDGGTQSTQWLAMAPFGLDAGSAFDAGGAYDAHVNIADAAAGFFARQGTSTADAGNGLAPQGIGDRLVNQAIKSTGASWGNNGIAFPAGSIPTWQQGDDIHIRGAYQYFSFTGFPIGMELVYASSQVIRWTWSAATTLSFNFTAGTALSTNFTVTGSHVAGKWYYFDAHLSDAPGTGAGFRPFWSLWRNGTYEGIGGEMGGDGTSWTVQNREVGLMGSRDLGANGTMKGSNLLFVCVAIGAKAELFNQQDSNYTDCELDPPGSCCSPDCGGEWHDAVWTAMGSP